MCTNTSGEAAHCRRSIRKRYSYNLWVIMIAWARPLEQLMAELDDENAVKIPRVKRVS